jgi:hypothetical protein
MSPNTQGGIHERHEYQLANATPPCGRHPADPRHADPDVTFGIVGRKEDAPLGHHSGSGRHSSACQQAHDPYPADVRFLAAEDKVFIWGHYH